MHEKPRHPLAAYGVALGATALSLLVRWPLWPVLGNAVPQMTFFPAVMIAAYFGGFWPGVVATVLSAFAANYFVAGRPSALHFTRVNETAALVLFILVGTIISALCESLHRVRRQLVARERQRADEALRETEARFQQLADNIHEIFWMTDARQEHILYVSPGYEELWGRSSKSLYDLPGSWIESIHPDDRDRVIEEVKQRVRGVFTDSEFRLAGSDGSIRWVRSRAFPVKDENGDISRIAGLTENITDRKLAEAAQRESEQRFRTFVNHATDAFFVHGEKFVILDVNRRACESLGYTRDELLGMTPADIDPDITPALLDEIDRKLMAGEMMAFESRHRRKDGTVFPVEVRGQGFWEGGRRFTVALVRDMTERKKIEDALRESEERFRGTFENAAVGIANVDFEGRWLRVNQRLCDIVGYTREELLQKTFQDITHPDDLPISIEKFSQFDGCYSLEKRYIRKDGSLVWVELFESLQRDEAGEPTYAIAMIQDISKRKQLEGELRESEQRWRSLTEALPQLVWTAMPDGAVDYFSTQWTQHTGVPESELLGWQWLKTLHPDDREITRQLWTDSVGGLGPYDVEYRVRRCDGEYRWFKTRGVPIRDSDGGIFKWFGTCTDITEGIMAAEELRVAKEAAESANRAKDEFLANVSHEIRTPMNAILGMTELVLDTPLGDDQRQSLRTVKSAADNLLGIINDLLDFSKIEAGKLELDPGNFSLRVAIGDTLRALSVRAHRKGLELVCNVQQDVPDALIGDAGRLRQVLLNLVGNAIKFTDNGEVVVEVKSVEGGVQNEAELERPDGDSSSTLQPALCTLHFSVRDSGIGIPSAKQSTIFRAFEQEDASTTRKYGGTGLGLTIAARLVTLMGGSIAVESEVGRGSTFSFTARFGRQEQQPSPGVNARPVSFPNLRVLVVDDNAVNRQIMEQWLRDWGMEPTTVADGMAAMDALWHGVAVGKPHSLLLLDARMPDTDGRTLAGKIRERAELSGSRIILLTSGDRPADLARRREVHVDGHLLKPVQQDELLETIYSIMSRKNGDAPVPARSDSSRGSGKSAHPPAAVPLRILVAEDSEFSAQLMEKLLVKRGHRVRVVGNGGEALSTANAADFDLLLLDVHMPGLDGFQVIRSIREQERATGAHLSVIALTARSRDEDRELCLAAGMDEFLSKPIHTDHLWEIVERLMSARAPAPGDPSPTPTTTQLVDPRVLLAACGGDADILKSICETLRARLPDHLATLQEALSTQDAPRLREAAHKLFGMIAAFSTAAGAVASDLEDLAARGQLTGAAALMEQLNKMAAELPRVVGDLSIEDLRHDAGSGDGRD
ncbi:MAG TPA: PAS domain S-box protein [Tepidisphaeraceae bacterium]|nr:PAS domain S-box protein [Tepidisphaeraceae bacterium]